MWQPALDEPDDATSSAYRAISAFFGRLGLGIDLRKQTPGSLRSIHRWLALYKKFRSLLHSGTTVRSDESDRGFVAHGVVADDRDEALFALVWLERALASRRVRIDGLDPATSYRIEVDRRPPRRGSDRDTVVGVSSSSADRSGTRRGRYPAAAGTSWLCPAAPSPVRRLGPSHSVRSRGCSRVT